MSDNEIEEEPEPSAPFWMATFSDMATLLMTFFVMIVAMSEVEVKKFKAAMSYFQGGTGLMQHDIITPPAREQVVIKRRRKEQKQQQSQRFEKLLKFIQEQNLEDKVQVNLTDEGLHVIITDSIMFHSGQSVLLDASKDILQRVAGVLANEVQSVIVEGHTDNRPIHTSTYPSNWELSGARASSVVRHLLTQESALAPDRYISAGFGEFRPIASNQTPDGRAKNRRVEILFSWEPWQSLTQRPELRTKKEP